MMPSAVTRWETSEYWACSAIMLAVARLMNSRTMISAVREFRERRNETAIQGCEYSTGGIDGPRQTIRNLRSFDIFLTNSLREIACLPTTGARQVDNL